MKRKKVTIGKPTYIIEFENDAEPEWEFLVALLELKKIQPFELITSNEVTTED